MIKKPASRASLYLSPKKIAMELKNVENNFGFRPEDLLKGTNASASTKKRMFRLLKHVKRSPESLETSISAGMEVMRPKTTPFSRLSKGDKMMIVDLLETSPFGPATSAHDVAQMFNATTSARITGQTVRKVLKERNYSYRRTSKINPDPSQARFEHVLRYWDIATRIDPRNMFFFDEQPLGNRNKDVAKSWQRKDQPLPVPEAPSHSEQASCTLVLGATLAGVESGLPAVIFPRVMYGSVTNVEILDYFVRTVLPGIPPGGWIILDNASPHVSGLKKMVPLAAKMHVGILFLPSKSPWWNPVENVFAWIKHRVRRLKHHAEWCHLPLGLLMLAAATHVENQHVVNYFRHCGYNVGDGFRCQPNRFKGNFHPSLDDDDDSETDIDSDHPSSLSERRVPPQQTPGPST